MADIASISIPDLLAAARQRRAAEGQSAWIVGLTAPGKEFSGAAFAVDEGFEIYLPEVFGFDYDRGRAGRTKMFEGIVFIRVDGRDWRPLLRYRSKLRLFTRPIGEEYVDVVFAPAHLVDNIIAAEDATGVVRLPTKSERGSLLTRNGATDVAAHIRVWDFHRKQSGRDRTAVLLKYMHIAVSSITQLALVA